MHEQVSSTQNHAVVIQARVLTPAIYRKQNTGVEVAIVYLDKFLTRLSVIHQFSYLIWRCFYHCLYKRKILSFHQMTVGICNFRRSVSFYSKAKCSLHFLGMWKMKNFVRHGTYTDENWKWLTENFWQKNPNI